MYFKVLELCMEKNISCDFTILQSEFILYFSCRVKNVFWTTLLTATSDIEEKKITISN